MKNERITQAEYARRHKWNRTYVGHLVRTGVLTLGPDKLLDPVVADRQLAASKAGRSSRDYKAVNAGFNSAIVPEDGKIPTVTLTAAKAKREYIRAQMEELDYKTRLAELVEVKTMEREAFQAARMVRDAFLAFPDRLSTLLAAEQDPAKVHDILSRELKHILHGLADES